MDTQSGLSMYQTYSRKILVKENSSNSDDCASIQGSSKDSDGKSPVLGGSACESPVNRSPPEKVNIVERCSSGSLEEGSPVQNKQNGTKQQNAGTRRKISFEQTKCVGSPSSSESERESSRNRSHQRLSKKYSSSDSIARRSPPDDYIKKSIGSPVTTTETGKLSTVTRKIEVKPARFTYPTTSKCDYFTNTPQPPTPEGPRFVQEGTQLTFTHPGVQNDILKNLYSLQMRGDMCDVLIRVEGVDFKCHKIVLSAACPYFADLFKEIKSVRMDRLILEGLSAQSVAAMIGYFYMARLIVDVDDVEELLESAYYFKTNEVVQLCIDYLEINLAVYNCFTFYELAIRHNIKDFRIKTFRYICWNFKSVVKEPRFHEISIEVLQQIISSTQVKVKAEEEVYSAVWSWYRFNSDERKPHLSRLCNDINFHLMDISFIEETIKNEMYLDSETCRAKIDTAVELIKKKIENDDDDNMKLETYRQVSDNIYIFITTSNLCKLLDLVTCKTELAPELHLPVSYIDANCHVTIKAGKKLYTLSRTKVLCFNPASMCWECFADGIAVTDSAVCNTKTSIFVAGGKPNGKQLWELSLSTRKWESHPEMETDRRSPAAACMGNTRPRVFVAGGFSLNKDCILNTMECYNAAEKIWKTIKRTMSVPRLQPGIIIRGDLVFVVGGRNMDETLDTVDVFDRSAQRWSTTDGPLVEAKLEPTLVQYEGKIVCIAGKGCSSIEVLEDSDKVRNWRQIGRLDKPAVGLHAVVYQPI